jgi:hypothetical protein
MLPLLCCSPLNYRIQKKLEARGSGGREREQVEEMTQTMYAHVNK